MMHMDLGTLPKLQDVTAVPDAIIEERNEGIFVLLMAAALNLGFFEAQDGSWWLGLRGDGFSEHDRWLCHIPNPQAADAFEAMEHELLFPCRPRAEFLVAAEMDLDAPPSLVNHLSDMVNTLSLFGRERKALASNGGPAAALRFLQAFQAFGWISSTQMTETMHAAWGPELHDLIHHPDAWEVRHPEARDLPRELVLRMHGLGTYAAALTQTGVDWHVISER